MKTAHRNPNNQRFALAKTLAATLCLTTGFLALPAYAVTNELVGSAESHSIEKYDSNGNWIKTFASTGPYYPVGIAASPITGDVFAATLTATVLRYTKSGASFGPKGAYWSTFNMTSLVGSNPPEALLFDPSGNLYVATNYGESGYVVKIFEYSAKELLKETPVPTPGSPIVTTIGQAGQMAWDANGNLCIDSWYYPEGVQCYNPGTHALTFSYAPEIQAAALEPLGIAFGPGDILTVSNLFTGGVYVEGTAQVGPMNLVATGTVQPADVGFLAVDSDGNLYLPEWHNVNARFANCVAPFYSCQDYDVSSDIVYKIDPTNGTLTNFISNHLWGPYQMIFVSF
jgi:hypothetical protein